VKLKRKKMLKKTMKRMRTKLEKITYPKLGLKDEIEKKIKSFQKSHRTKLEIKRIRIKVKILIN
jgi:hypothetical protein